MSVRYRKVQNKIKNSTNFNLWYGRAVVLGNVSTRNLAEEISHSTTVTYADIMAVLIELSEAIKRHLLNSQSVKVDGLGTFRVGLRTTATEKKEDFNISKIKAYSVVFLPEATTTAVSTDANGKTKKVYTKTLLQGISVEEMATTKADSTSTSTGTGSGN